MIDKNEVSAVLDLIRPSLIADGGDVTLVDVTEDGKVVVELTGACKGCPLSQLTLANGIERILKERVPGVEAVVPAEEQFDQFA
ncbi:MAG: NifU family protein [Eggerthellaceae bacterium]|nr:NifU family protein [Eggerthellaceae bacterium]